jgi:iron(III) transport system ATP-binding protein
VQMRTELRALQRKLGITTIFVTHDQEEAMTTADRIAVMDQGVIQQVGTPMALYDEPVNRFVANFVGSINLLPGTIEAAVGGVTFRTPIFGAIHLPLAKAAPGAAEIAIRPHSLVLATTRDDSPHAWAEGIIADREFLGEFVRYSVHVKDMALTADQPHFSGEKVYAAGDRVHVGVSPTRVRLM